MDKYSSSIFVAGHNGMVGSAIVRNLEQKGYNNLLVVNRNALDLTNQNNVNFFFKTYKPEYVFLAAAKVGGINANATYPAEFIYQNLMIEANVIHAAYLNGAQKLMALGSSCIYPKFAPNPIKEEYLLTGELECSNEAYAIAKIAGLEMCKHYNNQYHTNFLSVMPTSLYGQNDNYDPKLSHVIPALIRKFHEAKINNLPSVSVWGTGKATREFLYVDDLADACVFLMERYDATNLKLPINVGTGHGISIRSLAVTIKSVVGYKGEIIFDTSKPDGTPQKTLDVSRLTQLGWTYSIHFFDGIQATYKYFLEENK